MADYLFNFSPKYAQAAGSLSDQARRLLRVGVWGIPYGRAYYKQIQAGDRVVAYAGGTEQVFVGDAVLVSAFHPLTPEERRRLYPGALSDGVTLGDGRIWDRPVARASVWSRMTLANRLLRGSIMEFGEGDFELLLAEVADPPGHIRPFDPSRRPSAYGQMRSSDPAAAAALAEKANQDHHDLVAALDRRLQSRGWTEVVERPDAFDLRGRDRAGLRHIFEVKTVRAGHELRAARAGLAQLLEYRVLYGSASDELCLVTNAPIGERRTRVLSSLDVAVVIIDDAEFRAGSKLTEARLRELLIATRDVKRSS